MKLFFKLDPTCSLVYDTCNLDVFLTDQIKSKFIEIELFPIQTSIDRYVNLKTKFRPISQKKDTLVVVLPICNGECWYCSNKNLLNSNTQHLNEFANIIEKYSGPDINLVVSGGEPTENFEYLRILLANQFNNIQIFTTLAGLNSYRMVNQFIDLLTDKNVSLFITVDGLHSSYHPTYNKHLHKLLNLVRLLKEALQCDIMIKQNLSSPNFFQVYYHLLDRLDFDFGYSVLALLESYANTFTKQQRNTLRKLARINYQKIATESLPIRDNITYFNMNFTSNILPLLKGHVITVNNSHHVLVGDKIHIFDPIADYVCYSCEKYPYCNNCKKFYQRCKRCPILYTCCHTSSLIPYYKKTTCEIAIRAELINYYLIFKSKRGSNEMLL